MKAKTEQREHARALRLQGKTYDEIVEELGVSKSSVSLWVRDLPRPRRSADDLRRHMDMMRGVRSANLQRARDRNHEISKREMHPFTDRDLLIAGVALYWAEGTKSKAWRPSENVVFTNSDFGVISVFMAWLRMLGIHPADCTFRVSIHETADVDGAVRSWAALLGVDPASFLKPLIKRHNPKTVRHNTSDTYRGCLIVRVRRGGHVYQRIEGWWTGIVEAARTMPLED